MKNRNNKKNFELQSKEYDNRLIQACKELAQVMHETRGYA